MLHTLAIIIFPLAFISTLAVMLLAGAAGGAIAASSEVQRKSASKSAAAQKKAAAALAAANKDKLVVTPKGIAKKNARAALVAGSPRGVLSTEDQTATGRGTLLGN